MNGSIKIPVTVDATQFEKGVKDAVKDAKKELQTLNGEEILTPESIEKQVKEREKLLKKVAKEESKKFSGMYHENEDVSWQKFYDDYNKKRKYTDYGEYWQKFFDRDSKQWLESPAQLQEELTAKMLKQKEEIAEMEKKITKENELQAKAEQNKLDDVEEQTTKKKGGFLNTLASFGSKAGGALGNVGQFVAIIGKIAVAGVLIKGLMAVLERVFMAIVTKVNELMNNIKKKNSEIFTKIMVIKSMVDSIMQTIRPFMTQLLHGFLNSIIEAFRFIQHVVYAITGVDIFKYTGQKLAENMKEAAKGAGELRKQLMGFDEANVINDSGSTSSLAFSQDYADQLMNNLKIDEHYFDKLKAKIKEFYGKVKEYANDPSLLTSMLGPWRGMGSGISQILLVDIPGLFRDLGGIVGGWSKIITGFLTGDWQKMCEGIQDVWKNTLYLIRDIFFTVWDVITLPIRSAIEAVKWFWETWLEPNLKKLHQWLDEHIGKFVSWLFDKLKWIANWCDEHLHTHFNIDVNADTSQAENKMSSLLKKAINVAAVSSVGIGTKAPLGIIPGISSAIQSLRNKFGFDGGGIVLPVPGHGVPIGINSVMSERRAEGIIPLENPTAMEKLGEAIGRYVNLAITNNMVVDGRVLATATNNQLNKERFLMNR